MARARATHLSLGRLQLQLVLYVFLQPSVPELLDPVLCVIYSWYIVKTVGRSDRPIWICTSRVLCNPWTRASVWGGSIWGWVWIGIPWQRRKGHQLGTRSVHGDHGTERKPSPVSVAPGGRSTVLVPTSPPVQLAPRSCFPRTTTVSMSHQPALAFAISSEATDLTTGSLRELVDTSAMPSSRNSHT